MIEVRNLSKRFGDLLAIDDLSFKVVPGEILGFLGPNGAGKSTTMKMITGFLSPTSGGVSVYGADVESDSLTAQSLIGYLPEGAPCYEEMTPFGFLNFIAEARGFSGDEKEHRVSQAIKSMSLQGVTHQRIETLSKGFKRRVGMAQAILHDPQVLILDEPTDGLDPNQKQHVREMIRGLSKDKIVIISTHILEEVTAVCTRAIIISEGRIVADQTPEALLAMSRYHGAVTLQLESTERLEEIATAIEALSQVQAVETNGLSITAFGTDEANHLITEISHQMQSAQWPVESIFQEKGRLDEVFQQVTQGVSA